MVIEPQQMLPITQLQKDLSKTIRNVASSGNTVYILKNNTTEAVLLSFDEYEYLKEIEEIFERLNIKSSIETRMKKYEPKNNVSWKRITKRK